MDRNKPARYDWQTGLKTLILLGMGIYFVFLIVSGNLANYINLRFQWLTYLAAALLLALGLYNVFTLLRRQANHGLRHAQITPAALFVAGIPLLFALVPSRPLGVEAITGGVSLNAVGASTVAAYEKTPLERNILDWLREFATVETPAALDDQPVDVIGFVYREPGMTESQFMVARFTLSCCVADAFAIGMPVEYADSAQLKEGDWVRIQGRLQAGLFDEQPTPIIQPDSVEVVDAPETPYLYP
jgi:putative membrane protein